MGDFAWYGAVLLFGKLDEFFVNLGGNCHGIISGSWHTTVRYGTQI
jgi:hypothetical protein